MSSFEKRVVQPVYEAGERGMAERVVELLTQARAIRELAEGEARSLRVKERIFADEPHSQGAGESFQATMRIAKQALAKLQDAHNSVIREILRDIVLTDGVGYSIKRYGSLQSWMHARGVPTPSLQFIDKELREIEALLRQANEVSSRLGKQEDDR